MNAFYHWSQIKSLTIGQALTGERTPMFNVVLERDRTPASSADVAGPNKDQYLYVFEEKYSYLQGDDCDDKAAYREVMSEHLKYKMRRKETA
jgi:hypothetical protein